jgi:hypothetical protein
MYISIRDKAALCAALIGGPAFGFLATETSRAGHRGILVTVPYVLALIPATVLLSEQLKIVVWQASVISFAVYVSAWNLLVQKIDFAKGGAGLSFAQIVFVLWTAVTIPSAPVPLYFWLRRIATPNRYYVVSAVTVAAIVLCWVLAILVG